MYFFYKAVLVDWGEMGCLIDEVQPLTVQSLKLGSYEPG